MNLCWQSPALTIPLRFSPRTAERSEKLLWVLLLAVPSLTPHHICPPLTDEELIMAPAKTGNKKFWGYLAGKECIKAIKSSAKMTWSGKEE